MAGVDEWISYDYPGEADAEYKEFLSAANIMHDYLCQQRKEFYGPYQEGLQSSQIEKPFQEDLKSSQRPSQVPKDKLGYPPSLACPFAKFDPLKYDKCYETPCPYLQDPVISIVSSVVDDFETRLREMIRSSNDLDDLANRIPIIRGQFLARYGIIVDDFEQDPPSLASLRTVSSSPTSGGGNTATPPDVTVPNQPHLGGDTNHDQSTLSSDSQQGLNILPTKINAHQDVPLEPVVNSDPVWLQNEEFLNFHYMSGWDLSTWDPDNETTNDANNNLYVTESSKDLHGYGPLIQKESLTFS
ncbi:hypothetical protein KCU64_g2943, partial [Aureobasidium melanogenum]